MESLRPPADHVVLVALDGFGAAYLDVAADLPTPHLDALAARGSLTTGRGVLPSVTNPSWASVATGAWPERHLNTAYFFDPVAGSAQGQQRDLAVPTIAEAVRDAGMAVASVQWPIVQDHGTRFGDPDALYTQPGGGCTRRFDDAVAVLRGRPVRSGGRTVTVPGPPRFLAVYSDVLDGLGHAGGPGHPRIPAALREIDAQLGRLVSTTEEIGTADRTAFVLLGDHGMTAFTRGFGRVLRRRLARAGLRAEILRPGGRPEPRTDVAVVVGGVASLHLLGAARHRSDAVATIRRAVASLPQVQAVWDRHEQAEHRMSPRLGELVVEPRPGWSPGGAAPAFLRHPPRGRHGTTAELDVAFLLAGSGVRPGAPPAAPRHVDVAPTIAALLGVAPPSGTQGRVLAESLDLPGRPPD
ncbi:putative AlkP superfamily pyrophosphatase or phosphodiesterase [Isoptericola jiangsuensis]|uniref:Putative AlkP superfamily pyrophosphatase or phosphodiesterase n=1 Tax=Isoptericola jiangsuensis TaxID=548579 RepID=A0A2A9EQW7_9MICO|nr:alkaline phosphatase family protein [Isoptericola jiangsuensis]PFG41517.1 putative AlkP superfamily pyrophosphatase or phosphodiesterase [Isoptericola jiangsuensis]